VPVSPTGGPRALAEISETQLQNLMNALRQEREPQVRHSERHSEREREGDQGDAAAEPHERTAPGARAAGKTQRETQ
jgi:hypothetical protein